IIRHVQETISGGENWRKTLCAHAPVLVAVGEANRMHMSVIWRLRIPNREVNYAIRSDRNAWACRVLQVHRVHLVAIGRIQDVDDALRIALGVHVHSLRDTAGGRRGDGALGSRTTW